MSLSFLRVSLLLLIHALIDHLVEHCPDTAFVIGAVLVSLLVKACLLTRQFEDHFTIDVI